MSDPRGTRKYYCESNKEESKRDHVLKVYVGWNRQCRGILKWQNI
jgi:hypothetical protein